MGPTAVRVDRLSKSFGDRRPLTDVALEVRYGEVVVLRGDNGSGKTTFLRLLATTLAPDAGAVTIDGIDAVARPGAARRRTGVLIGDDRTFYWQLTVRENLRFFLGIRGVRGRRFDGWLEEVSDAFGLADVMDVRLGSISAGLRTRVALARAFAPDARLLLLDEPGRTLDRSWKPRLLELVRQRADDGSAVLIASHDPLDPEGLRFAHLVGGRFVEGPEMSL